MMGGDPGLRPPTALCASSGSCEDAVIRRWTGGMLLRKADPLHGLLEKCWDLPSVLRRDPSAPAQETGVPQVKRAVTTKSRSRRWWETWNSTCTKPAAARWNS